jgi:hypothetical protein
MSVEALKPPDREEQPELRGASVAILAAGAMAALFFCVFLLLPRAGPFAFPFAGVPVTRLAHRRGTGAALLGSAIAAGLVLLAAGSSGPLSSGLGAGLFAAAVTALPSFFAASVRRGVDPSRGYLGLCVAGFVLACGFLLAHPSETDASIGRELDQAFDQWEKISSGPGGAPTDAETAARRQGMMTALRDFTKRFWIGLIGVSWTLGCAIAYYVGAWAARPAPSAEGTRFEQLRVPAPFAALFVASGAGWGVFPEPWSRIAGNLLWPLAALYFVAGLSIICHFARRWFRPRILRIGLYALVIYVPINVGVALLGLFDWYADFRHRGREIKES